LKDIGSIKGHGEIFPIGLETAPGGSGFGKSACSITSLVTIIFIKPPLPWLSQIVLQTKKKTQFSMFWDGVQPSVWIGGRNG
jgi:hypothetical protein